MAEADTPPRSEYRVTGPFGTITWTPPPGGVLERLMNDERIPQEERDNCERVFRRIIESSLGRHACALTISCNAPTLDICHYLLANLNTIMDAVLKTTGNMKRFYRSKQRFKEKQRAMEEKFKYEKDGGSVQ